MPQVFDIGDRVKVIHRGSANKPKTSPYFGLSAVGFVFPDGGVTINEHYSTHYEHIGIVTDRWLDEKNIYRIAVRFSENDSGVFEASELTKLPMLAPVSIEPEQPTGIINRLLGRK